MYKTILIAVLTSLTFLISCSFGGDNNPGGPEVETQIMPLKIGNLWFYHSYQADNTDEITEIIMEITKDTVIEDQKWYYIPRNNITHLYYGYHESGIQAGYLQPDGSFDKELYLRYPCNVGENFSITESKYSTVESINDTITTKAGTYRCIKYSTYVKIQGEYIKYRDIYASPELGPVKTVYFEKTENDSTNSESVIIDLISYKLE